MINDGDCGDIGGMKIGRGNRSTRRKPLDGFTRMQWPKHFAEELTCKIFGLDTFNRVNFADILYNRPELVI
jgi:hypothetical protein